MAIFLNGTDGDLITVSQLNDRLGWDSFLEGRISSHWLSIVAPFLRRPPGQYLLPLAWGRQFINMLHNIVHRQWIYRNSFIHFKGKDGLTIPEHHDKINLGNYTLSDPDILLPRHRFLFEADFVELASGPTSYRLLWLAAMDTVIVASSLPE